jgi:hypothetical protein
MMKQGQARSAKVKTGKLVEAYVPGEGKGHIANYS